MYNLISYGPPLLDRTVEDWPENALWLDDLGPLALADDENILVLE